MNNLIRLDLSQNNLQGTLPSSLHIKYDWFSVAHNNLHGALPLPLKNTTTFDLSHNNFTGEISIEIGERLSRVAYIFLSSNQLSGSIPSSICSTELYIYGPTYIDLSNNKVSGVIPPSIGNCTNLRSLNLGTNNLTGCVPKELEAISLNYLLLNDNKLEGGIAFGSLYSAKIISLRSNKFNGSIPEEVIHFSRLQILDLSRNYFSGQLPRNIGKLEMLTSRPNTTSSAKYDDDVQLQMVIKGIEIQLEKLYEYSSGIDLSCNSFEGSIPEEIGLLKGLSMLNLSHNGFSGTIPASVGNMTGLGSLDLSFNKLFGKIPESLTSLDSLGFLNLSYNNLSGRIPEGPHFDTLSGDGSAYLNNSFLCGLLTNNICEADHQSTNTTPNNVEEDYQDDAKDRLLLCAIVAVGFGAGFWGLFFVFLLKKEKLWFPYWRLVDMVARRVARCVFGL
ncbi:hypothetical protein MKW92_000156 [Papaver armeniacum]|nr:hypothetical protein MKW92_000156 [Papaver armeniacum]